MLPFLEDSPSNTLSRGMLTRSEIGRLHLSDHQRPKKTAPRRAVGGRDPCWGADRIARARGRLEGDLLHHVLRINHALLSRQQDDSVAVPQGSGFQGGAMDREGLGWQAGSCPGGGLSVCVWPHRGAKPRLLRAALGLDRCPLSFSIGTQPLAGTNF